MANNPSDMSIADLLAAEAGDLVNPLPIEYYAPEFGQRRIANLMAMRSPLVRASRQGIPVAGAGIRGADVRRWGEQQGALASAAAEVAQRADIESRQEMDAAALKRAREEAAAEDATRRAQYRLRATIGREVGGAVQEGIAGGTAIAGYAKEHQEGLREKGKELASQMGRQLSYMDTLTDVGLGQQQRALGDRGLVADIGLQAPELNLSNRHWLDYRVGHPDAKPIYSGIPVARQPGYGDILSGDL